VEPSVRTRREIYRILVAISAGEATPEQHARLDLLVREHPWARACVVDAVTQMSDLEWEVREGGASPERVIRSSDARLSALSTQTATTRIYWWLDSWRSLWRGWGRGIATFAFGAAIALVFVIRLGFERPQHPAFVVDDFDGKIPVARLVSTTNFMIDAVAGRAMKEGDPIHAGRSVTLLEGVAEVEFGNHVTVRLKGPALLSIDARGVPHLKYGRVILANQGQRQFQLDLPVAETTIAPNSYVGIDGHGDDAFVYAFEGAVQLSPQGATTPTSVNAGTGMRVRRGARSDIILTPREIDSTAFDFELLMTSDQINVTSDYVQAINAAHPIAYWRFEEEDARLIKNEVGASHALDAHGDGVRIASRDGNGVAEFVIRDSAACLTSVDAWDELKDSDYSVEMWVKPSHFQWGTLAALVEHGVDSAGAIERHAMLVELQGANTPPEGRAKAIRYLHRSPPSDQPSGTSCFSSVFYRAQIWQHVAAVKRGDQLNLYLNGELVASANDSTHLPGGLQLIVGQLFSFGTVRPFVGHIDEMAVYARALSVEEIRQRVALIRGAPHGADASSTVGAAK
jgi:hypothetical protein